MVFAYARVSTKEQGTERQIRAISEYAAQHGVTIDRVFEEKASGKDFKREVYQALKLTLRAGDTLIIKELDRLGRNMAQIKDEWRGLEESGVCVIVTENEILNTANKSDLERTLISNIVFELLSYMAQKERDRMRLRQAEGIAAAKAAGRYKGRQPIRRENFGSVYKIWRAGEITAVKAMDMLKLSRSTFYRKVREYEGEREKAPV